MDHHSTWTRRLGVASALPLALAMASTAGGQSPQPSMAMAPDPAHSIALSGLEEGSTVTANKMMVDVEAIGFTPRVPWQASQTWKAPATTTPSWTARSSTWNARRPRR